jgi:tetrahydrodipicolinate N-succinyltransferase
VVLTNDTYPRAINGDGSLKSASDWDAVGVTIEDGAAIGARAVCVAPVRIGAWAMVAAGSVVTRDVPPHALVAGVPARQLGWVSRSGTRLEEAEGGTFLDPSTGTSFHVVDGQLEETAQ